MMPNGTHGQQRHFGEMRRERSARAELGRDVGADVRRSGEAAEAALAMTSEERSEAVRQLESAACDYLRMLGVGAEFHSQMMTSWIHDCGRWPSALRGSAMGGVVRRLQRGNYVSGTGEFRRTSGIRKTGTNGGVREMLRIERVPEGSEL